jgi:hypothetical protein
VTTAAAASAIGALLARYAELIDAGDFAGVGALLGDCRVLTGDRTLVATGADEIAGLYEQTTRRYDDGTPHTQHLITNLIVEPATRRPDPDDGGRLWSARSRFTVLQSTEDLGLAPIIAGRYRDVVHERRDGTWAFVERQMAPELFGDLSHHLLFEYRR